MSNEGVLASWLQGALQGSTRALELDEGRLVLCRSSTGAILRLEMSAIDRHSERLIALLERRYTDMADLENGFISNDEAGVWILSWVSDAEGRDSYGALLEGAGRLCRWAASGR